jgi:hypothetical protein
MHQDWLVSSLAPPWIHFLVAGREDDVHAGGAAKFEIALQIARVSGKILLRSELRRVHVNAHDNLAGLPDAFPRLMDKTQVAGVQIAHRRHKADAFARALPFFGKLLHRGDVGDDSHTGKVSVETRPINSIVGFVTPVEDVGSTRVSRVVSGVPPETVGKLRLRFITRTK